MNDNIHINVNHEVLVWARESLALNRAQAIESTGISPKRIVQLESGEKQPTLEELKAFLKTVAAGRNKHPFSASPFQKSAHFSPKWYQGIPGGGRG